MNSLSIFVLSAVALMSSIESNGNVCISGNDGDNIIMNGEYSDSGKTVNGKPYYRYTVSIKYDVDFYIYYLSGNGQISTWVIADHLDNGYDDTLNNICGDNTLIPEDPNCDLSSFTAHCPLNTVDLTQCSGHLQFGDITDPQVTIGFCESATTSPPTTTSTTTTTISITAPSDTSTTTPSPTTTTTTSAAPIVSSCENKITFSGKTGFNTFVNGEWELVPNEKINGNDYYTKEGYYLFYVSGCHAFNQWIIATSLYNGYDANICSICSENNYSCYGFQIYYAQCPKDVALADCSQKWQFYNSAVSQWQTDGTVQSTLTDCSTLSDDANRR